MFFIVLFPCELIFVFFLSHLVTRALSYMFFSFTKNRHTAVSFFSLLFLPGVVIHELSHMLMAEILFVRAGSIEFLPKIHGDSVKLGSVAIAKTDPVRRFLIGVAPLFGGLGVIVTAFFYFPLSLSFRWQSIVLVYILFEISNTMFSSKKDLEGALGLFIFVLFAAIAFVLLGFKIPYSFFIFLTSTKLITFFQTLDAYLFFVILINSAIYIVTKLFSK